MIRKITAWLRSIFSSPEPMMLIEDPTDTIYEPITEEVAVEPAMELPTTPVKETPAIAVEAPKMEEAVVETPKAQTPGKKKRGRKPNRNKK